MFYLVIKVESAEVPGLSGPPVSMGQGSQTLQSLSHSRGKATLSGQLRDHEDILRSTHLVRTMSTTWKKKTHKIFILQLTYSESLTDLKCTLLPCEHFIIQCIHQTNHFSFYNMWCNKPLIWLTKLLYSPISAPGQLQSDMHTATLINSSPVRLQGNTRTSCFWDDGNVLEKIQTLM